VLHSGGLRYCSRISDQIEKAFPRTNALAYFASSSVKKNKSLLILTLLSQCLQNICVGNAAENKLECLGFFLSLSVCIVFQEPTLKVEHLKGVLQVLPKSKCMTRLKRWQDKHSSLFLTTGKSLIALKPPSHSHFPFCRLLLSLCLRRR
jgi:hypothetical protein